MTAQTDDGAKVLHFPDVKSAGPDAEPTRSARAPARDKPERKSRVPNAAMITGVLAGASVIAPMLGWWAQGAAAARYYDNRWVRWPRYGWAAIFAWVIVPVLEGIKHTLFSPPVAAGTLGVTFTVLLLLHVIGF